MATGTTRRVITHTTNNYAQKAEVLRERGMLALQASNRAYVASYISRRIRQKIYSAEPGSRIIEHMLEWLLRLDVDQRYSFAGELP